MVYSYPLDRRTYHLTSPDGINDWTNQGLAVDATQPFIKYTDGITKAPRSPGARGCSTAECTSSIDVEAASEERSRAPMICCPAY
jgi:hypothetical protein